MNALEQAFEVDRPTVIRPAFSALQAGFTPASRSAT